MTQTYSTKATKVIKGFVPALFTVLLSFFSVIPLNVFSHKVSSPSFALMAVFYWSLYRPNLMPVFLVFLLGIIQDSFMNIPLGISSFLFLVVQVIVTKQRRFLMGQTFLVVWLCFVLTALSAGLIHWVLYCVFTPALAPIIPTILKILFEIALFPLIVWLIFSRILYWLK